MAPWLRYLIAFVVFCHGFIYLRVLPQALRAWGGRSWLLDGALTQERLKALVVALHVIAGIATLACALAIGLAPSVPGWWRPLAMVGGAVGIAAFAVFWSGRTELLMQEGGIGAIVSLILLLSAVAFPGAFA